MNILYHIVAAHNKIANIVSRSSPEGRSWGSMTRFISDLDRSHTVLSPDEARQFSAELKRIADEIEPFSAEEGGE